MAPILPGGYLKSMRLGNQDVLTEEMMIRPSTAEPLKIVISTRARRWKATYYRATSHPRCDRVGRRWKVSEVTSFYRSPQPTKRVTLKIKNAVPGKYRLYAFRGVRSAVDSDPGFLKPFESSGVAVTLRKGPERLPRTLPDSRAVPPSAAVAPGRQRMAAAGSTHNKLAIVFIPLLWDQRDRSGQLFPGFSGAVPPSEQTGKASVEGSVVDAVTREPVKKRRSC